LYISWFIMVHEGFHTPLLSKYVNVGLVRSVYKDED